MNPKEIRGFKKSPDSPSLTNTFETIENLLIGGQVNIDNVYNQIMENIRKILNLFLIKGERKQIEEKISSEV